MLEIEAAQLGCAAVEGLTALIERSDVDVVYLLTPQWFGLHPIEIACACRKPVYCALPLASEPEELEALAALVDASGIAFMPEFARRFYPATLRLRELLATTLGAPRLILGQNRLFGFDRYGQPGPTNQIAPAPLMIDPGSYLLDWCCFLFQAEPTKVQGFEGTIIPAGKEGARAPTSRASWPSSPMARWSRSRSDGMIGPSGGGEPVLAPTWVPGFCRARGGLARTPRTHSVVRRRGDARGTASPRTHGRRRPQRAVSSPRAGGAFACSHHSRRPFRRPTGERPEAEPARASHDRPTASALRRGAAFQGMDPNPTTSHLAPALAQTQPRPFPHRAWCLVVVILAGVLGLLLLVDSIRSSSASYDEVAYLKIAAHWWRTGDQEEISRMGSPLLFWKLQQAPLLWILDQTGHRAGSTIPWSIRAGYFHSLASVPSGSGVSPGF